jgi:hypothetical protein
MKPADLFIFTQKRPFRGKRAFSKGKEEQKRKTLTTKEFNEILS